MSRLDARRRMPRTGVRVVARREVLKATPPRLVDYHDHCDDVTVDLPKDESMFEIVHEDRGETRSAR